MAEIKIEKKKPIWPWILALLIIAAIVVFYFMGDTDYDDDMTTDDVEEIDDLNGGDVGSLNPLLIQDAVIDYNNVL